MGKNRCSSIELCSFEKGDASTNFECGVKPLEGSICRFRSELLKERQLEEPLRLK